MNCTFSNSIISASIGARFNTSTPLPRYAGGAPARRNSTRRLTACEAMAAPQTQQPHRKTAGKQEHEWWYYEEEERRRRSEETEKENPAATAAAAVELRDVWRQVQGCDNWEGLLDPMDDILRNEIIRYGDFSQACYDAFDFDPYSKYCGSCKYPRSQLLQEVGLGNSGYRITRYLYATSNINLPGFFQNPRAPRSKLWSPHANWMGFIAVATDPAEIRRLGRRDIVIAWRGTVTKLEWIADLMDYLRPAEINPLHPHPDVKVESGFLNLYTARENDCRYCTVSAREQIESEIKRLVQQYQGEQLSITVTGHSLGSALAMISAYDIAEMGLNLRSDEANEQIPITVFSFSGPRVGNWAFGNRCNELGLRFLRVVNVHDGVPKVPGVLFNEKTTQGLLAALVQKLPWHYCHVGKELILDPEWSPFLKITTDPAALHDLEGLLHLVDGYHGHGRRFFLSTGRDPALVNKSCDLLKDEYEVPPRWRQDANRGLIRGPDGRWIQPSRVHHEHDADADADADTWQKHHWELRRQRRSRAATSAA